MKKKTKTIQIQVSAKNSNQFFDIPKRKKNFVPHNDFFAGKICLSPISNDNNKKYGLHGNGCLCDQVEAPIF